MANTTTNDGATTTTMTSTIRTRTPSRVPRTFYTSLMASLRRGGQTTTRRGGENVDSNRRNHTSDANDGNSYNTRYTNNRHGHVSDEAQQNEQSAITISSRTAIRSPGSNSFSETTNYQSINNDHYNDDDIEQNQLHHAPQSNEDTTTTNFQTPSEQPNENDHHAENENLMLNQQIRIITDRLRVLFFALTIPVVPLAAMLSFLILQLVYAALTSPSCTNGVVITPNDTNDNDNTTSTSTTTTIFHPLKLYTILTILMAIYAPNHKSIRSHLFNYDPRSNNNTTMIRRPRMIRFYDQLFHFICILYVYYGMVLVQSCKEDTTTTIGTTMVVPDYNNSNTNVNNINNNNMMIESICTISCPVLFDSMQRFVFILQIFAVVLLLPLICLPFIYLWILRRLNTDNAWLQFGNNGGFDGGDNVEDGDGRIVHVKDIMEGFRNVILIPNYDRDDNDGSEGDGGGKRWRNNTTRENGLLSNQEIFKQVQVVERTTTTIETNNNSTGNDEIFKDWNAVKDCCICMAEFDVKDINGNNLKRNSTSMQNSIRSLISQTRDSSIDGIASIASENRDIILTKCGHLFHKDCIGSWIKGNWNIDEVDSSFHIRVRGQRRRCPLCREDLSPPDNNQEVDE